MKVYVNGSFLLFIKKTIETFWGKPHAKYFLKEHYFITHFNFQWNWFQNLRKPYIILSNPSESILIIFVHHSALKFCPTHHLITRIETKYT